MIAAAPEWPAMRFYFVMIVATAGPGALMIATHLHIRFDKMRRLQLNSVYTIVTLIIGGMGIAVVGSATLWRSTGVVQISLAVPIGVVMGFFIVAADGAITTRLKTTSRGRSGSSMPIVPPTQVSRTLVRPAGLALGPDAARRRAAPRTTAPTIIGRNPGSLSVLGWLLAVAVAEEILYRGVLTAVALALPTGWNVLALILLTAMFSVIHISFGWAQMIAKLPLGVLALIATLALGTILPAITAHCIFNWYFWRKRRFTAVSAATTVWTA